MGGLLTLLALHLVTVEFRGPASGVDVCRELQRRACQKVMIYTGAWGGSPRTGETGPDDYREGWTQLREVDCGVELEVSTDALVWCD